MNMLPALAVIACVAVLAGAVVNPEEYVNTLGGTNSAYDLSRGNMLPLVTMPWGFNGWSVQSALPASAQNKNWFFHSNDRDFYGIRCTHQPSPWIGDYGNFLLQASYPSAGTGPVFSTYKPSNATWKPYLFQATLFGFGSSESKANVSVTPTDHGAVIRFQFPNYVSGTGLDQTRRLTLTLDDPSTDEVKVFPASGSSLPGMMGSTSANSGGVPSNFKHHFYMTVGCGPYGNMSIPFSSTQVNKFQTPMTATVQLSAAVPATTDITIRVATSLISLEQAQQNYKAEIGTQFFEQVLNSSKAIWRRTLSRVNVTAVGGGYTPAQQQDMLTVMYSTLYRAVQYPRFSHETLADNTLAHYSAFTGEVLPGPSVTDSGFWDAYRTVYPLRSLVYPDVLGMSMAGYVNAYQEGKWLPNWVSPGYRASMVGTMGDVVLADAIVKNISGFDMKRAYEAIQQDAFTTPPANRGRTCLTEYINLGYVPNTCSASVAETLNYMVSDFAIAQAAKALGNTKDHDVLLKRAQQYPVLFDNSTAFFRAKTMNGGWVEPFDQYEWVHYTEGGPWQYRFYVPYDPQGLKGLYAQAGLDMCDVMEKTQLAPSVFHSPGQIIHEMTELPSNCWGQYGHNNQPSHHMLPLVIAAGGTVTGKCARIGQFWTRQVLTRLYQPDADMFPGDEDNGEMSSWFILNALGLYQLMPSLDEFTVTSPLFEDVTVAMPDGKSLRILAHNNGPGAMYVNRVTWNGVTLAGVSLPYSKLIQGGLLEFFMSSGSDDTPSADQVRPPSEEL